MRACFLQFIGQFDVCLFVETSSQLDHSGDVFACMRGGYQGIDDGRCGAGAIESLFDGEHFGVGSGFALAAFGATLLYTSVSRDVAVYRAALAERLESELGFIALTVTEQAVIGDYASLRQMLEARVERARDVRAIVWTDPRGNPVGVEAQTPKVTAPPWFAALVDMRDPRGRQPIVVGGVSYGELSLQLSAASVVDRIWSNVQYGLQMLLNETGRWRASVLMEGDGARVGGRAVFTLTLERR